MSDTEQPIEEARTTRPRAGMVFRDRRQLPGLAMLLMAALALVAFMSATAQNSASWALSFGILALVLALGGVTWMFVGRNRTARTYQAGNHRGQH